MKEEERERWKGETEKGKMEGRKKGRKEGRKVRKESKQEEE